MINSIARNALFTRDNTIDTIGYALTIGSGLSISNTNSYSLEYKCIIIAFYNEGCHLIIDLV